MTSLQQIASEVVLLSPEDTMSRLRVEKMLRDLAQSGETPPDIQELAWQAIVILQGLLQSKQPAENVQQLNALLDQMLQAGESAAAPAGAAEPSGSGTSAASAPASLMSGFITELESALEEFEQHSLALERGDGAALQTIRRHIHTWKVDAGLVGLDDLSRGMHALEDALATAALPPPAVLSEALLQIKDQLAAFLASRRQGEPTRFDFRNALEILRTSPTSEPANENDLNVIAAQPAADPAPSAPAVRCYEIPADIDMDLVQEFRTESAEHFQQAELALMTLENDPSQVEPVNTVFRAFHTVKGVAGFLGLSAITELSHKAETFFDRFRKGQLVMQGAHTDLAFEALDMLKGLLGDLKHSIAAGRMTVPPVFPELIRRLESPESAEKAVARRVVPTETPSKVGEILVQEGQVAPSAVKDALSKQAEGDLRPVGEILVEQQAAKAVDVAHALRSQQPLAAREGEPEGMVKISTTRLDNLINMVGELVIAQSMVSQDPDIQRGTNQRLVRNVAQLNKITRSLQELALSMRMVSVKGTFQKMARLVRDLARKSHKDILFETEGEDTELDRNMVEAIADPLVHMVRNAADHGVEAPEERIAQGKAPQGRIKLRAAHEGGSVVITLSDDGRGLNKQKILAKAVQRGLADPSAQLTDAEIHNLVFMPGFSTADQVTDVSGRGVGMDVVRTNVEALRGTVDIFSKPNEGSLFSVRLPLTLAIIDGMVIRVGRERFILPTIAITETLRPRPQDISTVQGQAELVMLRGNLIPVCRLGRLFHVKDAIHEICDGILVVTESKSRRVALLVDELLDQQQVVIKTLGSVFGRVKGVSGGAILGDGQVSLILDVDGLIKLSVN